MKLKDFILSSEIHIDNYKTLCCDQNRHRRGIVCYIRRDLNYATKSSFPLEMENIFFNLLLPNTKPIVVEITYRPPCQQDFGKFRNIHFSKLDTKNNKIYIPGNLWLTFILIIHTFFKNKIYLKVNRFLVTWKKILWILYNFWS